MNNSIVKREASGKDIAKLVDKLQPVLEGEQMHHVLIACLSVAALVLKPELNPQELVSTVNDTSEWMSLYLLDKGNGEEVAEDALSLPNPKALMN